MEQNDSDLVFIVGLLLFFKLFVNFYATYSSLSGEPCCQVEGPIASFLRRRGQHLFLPIRSHPLEFSKTTAPMLMSQLGPLVPQILVLLGMGVCAARPEFALGDFTLEASWHMAPLTSGF